MELKKLKKQQDADKKAREDEVFGTSARKIPNKGYTVPKPFKLSHGKKPSQRAKTKELLLQETLKDCTFKPVTNESKNKALLKRILEQEDDYSEEEDTGQSVILT